MLNLNYTTQQGDVNLNNGVQPEVFLSREWFSKALLSMGEAVIATDQKGVVTSMNKVAEELTGWSLSESKGKPINKIFDAINDHTNLPIENPINQALKENKVVLLANHTILIKKDKTQRYIVDSAVPLHNDDSEIVGGALIFRDVTEQSVSRKKLAEIEGLLKAIMDNTSLAIDVKDLKGNYLFINPEKERVYNLKASEVIGKKSTEHLIKGAARSRRSDNKAIKQKCLVEYDHVIKHPDGTWHSYHITKFPLYDSANRVYAVCAISADISESKKNIALKEKFNMLEVILKSDMRYDDLTKNMSNMFFSLDRFLCHTSFNKTCEIFTGRKEEQVIGKTIQEVFPGALLCSLPSIKKCLKQEKQKTLFPHLQLTKTNLPML